METPHDCEKCGETYQTKDARCPNCGKHMKRKVRKHRRTKKIGAR